MKQSDNYSTDNTIVQYLKFSLEARVRAGVALDRKNKQEFQQQLARLHREYFTKFKLRSDIDRPSFAEAEKFGYTQPKEISKLNFRQQKILYYQILKLQELLGHTSIETREWEEKDNKGGKKVADEIDEMNEE